MELSPQKDIYYIDTVSPLDYFIDTVTPSAIQLNKEKIMSIELDGPLYLGSNSMQQQVDQNTADIEDLKSDVASIEDDIGSLDNLATSDKSSIVNAINETLSVLDPTQTADYIKNSKGLESGEISTNASILPWVEEMSHSTFDLSKFTVVGSPVITDDGIASGFSSSNFLRTPTIDFSKPFEIIFEENFINRPSGLFSRLLNIQGMTSSNNIGYYIQAKLASDSFVGIFNMVVNNTIHWEFMKFVWTGEQYQVYTRENETAKWILRNTYDSTVCPSNANNETTAAIVMGYHQNSGYSTDGSIDLKQFSIAVDGVPVFSGNKTGIDTIKPDDYTVVGTPTISADGVAKYIGTASGRITTTTIDFSTSSSWEIVFPYYTGNTNTGIQVIMGSETGSVLQLVRFQNTNTCQMQCPATSFGVGSSLSDFSLNLNTQYICKVGQFITNGVITTYFKYKADTDNNYTVLSNTNATNIFDYTGAIAIGGYNGTNMMAYGSIDLNAFKIYVDGNLVYQPCLKIPYTESKTGSKVVNAIYRDRVNDMYEQFGYAPYYTLDTTNTNYTIPKGEVYGMVNKVVPTLIAPDYSKPVSLTYSSGLVIDNDGWLEVQIQSSEATANPYVSINGSIICRTSVNSNGDLNRDTAMMVVRKGDVITSGGYTDDTAIVLTYYPFKV